MNDSEFLGHFWRLGNGDPNVRRLAIRSLVNSLKATNDMTSDEAAANKDLPPVEAAKCDDYKKKAHPRKSKEQTWKCKDFQFRLPKTGSSFSESFLNGLEYTTNRLVHGLSSGREAVRQGYAAALTALLICFPKAIPLSSVSSVNSW